MTTIPMRLPPSQMPKGLQSSGMKRMVKLRPELLIGRDADPGSHRNLLPIQYSPNFIVNSEIPHNSVAVLAVRAHALPLMFLMSGGWDRNFGTTRAHGRHRKSHHHIVGG